MAPGCEIFQPSKTMKDDDFIHDAKLLYSPKNWLKSLEETYRQLDLVTHYDPKVTGVIPPAKDLKERAIDTYLEVLRGLFAGISYGRAERSVRFDTALLPYNHTARENGEEMGYLALTMIGKKRLDNLSTLLKEIIKTRIAGHIVETGVWRGGASMFLQAMLLAYHQHKERSLFLCDSFHGLPPSTGQLHKGDVGWDGLRYSAVSRREVARHFHQYGLLTENVYFVAGYFNQTMPILAQQPPSLLSKIALLRLDGDMYQSTVDVLYHLYEKVTIGGFIIVDDWTGFPAKDACLDFLKVHKLSPKIVPIDGSSVYWQKQEEITVQKWRYEQKKFT